MLVLFHRPLFEALFSFIFRHKILLLVVIVIINALHKHIPVVNLIRKGILQKGFQEFCIRYTPLHSA